MAQKEHSICDGKNWIDVLDPSVAEMEELSQQYGLNHHIVRDCMQPEHLPKYEYVDDVDFFILRFYAHVSDKSVATIQELTNKIAIFYTEDFIITIHKAEAPFLSVIFKKFVYAKKCGTTTDVLAKIIWAALETFDDPANRLSERVDFYESQIMLKKTSNNQMEELYYIKRQASVSHKVLMLMGEPINHQHPKPGEESLLQDIKDQHLKMLTLYGQVLEDVNNLMNLAMSFAAQRTNDVVRILTIFSVFFMPLTFIVGIYGMNFEFMPELRQRWGYPAVLIFMAIVTVSIYLWFKRKNWL
jgi:magnesium transporter